MFDPVLLPAPPDVVDAAVGDDVGASIDLALPELLERLSVALHRHDPTGVRGPLFRSLASGGTPAAVRQRARTLLASADVRESLRVTLSHEHALDFSDAIHDAAVTVHVGPDDEPREPEPGERR